VVDILSDEKWAVALTGVFNGVDAGLANSRKIEMRVLIAHPFPPGLYFAAKSFLIFALRSEPEDARGLGSVVERIELEDCYFFALGRVTDLVVSDHRWTSPIGNQVRMNVPNDGVLGFALRKQGADNEPAVLRFGAAVEQEQGAAVGDDGHA